MLRIACRFVLPLIGMLALGAAVSAQQLPASSVQGVTPLPPSLMSLPRYPVRPPADPAKVESGKSLFSVNCSFCHGANAKGGEGGPNIVRSETVLNDKDGERIAVIVQNGILDKGMPRFTLSPQQISDIATFIHSFPVGEGARGVVTNVDPVVGNAQRGETFFNGVGGCGGCHAVSGDLAHIAAHHPARDLQVLILSGGRRPVGPAFGASPVSIGVGTTVSVKLNSGTRHEGQLQRIDEFEVSIIDKNSGQPMTFLRDSSKSPEVQIHDPLAAHLQLMRTLNDENLHDLTAYLVTFK
jgi:cytochrome c oxidase cbb3-type subunit III